MLHHNGYHPTYPFISSMSPLPPIRYIAYVRKSTEGDERQALSIESQKERIRELFGNLDIAEIIEERRTAFLPENRPAFARMIEALRQGQAQGVVAWHPDRLSRNELDAATIVYMVRTGVISDLKFGSYHFDNSPEGILMLQMALSHSQYFSAKLSKDVSRGLEKKAAMGWLPSRVPPGYLNTPDRTQGLRIVVQDPERFPLVRRMWDLMLSGGYSAPRILKLANGEWGYRTPRRRNGGGIPLSMSGIYKIFNNPFYTGRFEYPKRSGLWREGKHEPMVTPEEFERVQALLGRKGKPAPQTKTFAFTGLIRCGECGGMVTAEEKRHVVCSACKTKFSSLTCRVCPECGTPVEAMTNPTFRRYVYYHCAKRKHRPELVEGTGVPCSQGCLEVSELERQISEVLSRIQINQKYLDWAIRYLREAHKRESASRDAVQESQQRAFRDICRKLDAFLEMRMREEVTEEEYRTKKAALVREKAQYEELLADTGERQKKWLELSERTFQFARHARYWFAVGDEKRKREILTTLGSNLVLKDKTLSVEAAKPFSLLQEGLETVPEAKEGFEPLKTGVNSGQMASLDAVNPRWCGLVEAVRTSIRWELSTVAIGSQAI